MKTTLEFLDRHAIDPHIFFSVPDLQGRRIELYWERSKERDKWRLRSEDRHLTEFCSAEHLPGVLERWSADLDEVDRQLKLVAMTQVFFAQSLLEDAGAVFGAQEIERASLEHQRFLDSLRDVVRSLTRGSLSVLEGEAQHTGRSRARLSLVQRQAKLG